MAKSTGSKAAKHLLKLIKQAGPKAKIESKPRKLTVLEENLAGLKEKLRSGECSNVKIGLLGQPGAGKSSLLDIICNYSCVPRPVIGHQTNATDWSLSANDSIILNYDHVSFVDTPGYDTKAHPVRSYLNYFPFTELDKMVLMIKGKVHSSDEEIFRKIVNLTSNIVDKLIVVRSFSDDLTDLEKREIAQDFNEKFNLDDKGIKLVFLSNKHKCGIEAIKKFIGME